MSKLYMVYYFFGHVAASIKAFAEHPADDPLWLVDGKRLTLRDVETVCQFRTNPPKLGELR